MRKNHLILNKMRNKIKFRCETLRNNAKQNSWWEKTTQNMQKNVYFVLQKSCETHAKQIQFCISFALMRNFFCETGAP